MDQAKGNIMNLLRRHPFLRSNFGFDWMRPGIVRFLKTMAISWPIKKFIFESRSVGYITFVDELKSKWNLSAKNSFTFLAKLFSTNQLYLLWHKPPPQCTKFRGEFVCHVNEPNYCASQWYLIQYLYQISLNSQNPSTYYVFKLMLYSW